MFTSQVDKAIDVFEYFSMQVTFSCVFNFVAFNAQPLEHDHHPITSHTPVSTIETWAHTWLHIWHSRQ